MDYFYSAAEPRSLGALWPSFALARILLHHRGSEVEGGTDGLLDFRYVAANPAFETQSGVGGVVGKTIRQVFPGEPEEWFETYDAIVKTGNPLRFERNLGTQGRALDLYACRIEDARHRRVAVIFKDIAGRKQAELALARLAAIVECSDDAIIGKDLNGIIETWNAGAERVFGYTQREAIGQPVTLLIPPRGPMRSPPSWSASAAESTLNNTSRYAVARTGD